jgi:hypothetical protein
MRDFVYPKPLRFPNHAIANKRTMTQKDAAYLLSGMVVVEEKMDGRQTDIKVDRFIICAEDLRQVHTIRYRVPARYAAFDVYDTKSDQFLEPAGKKEVIGFYSMRSELLPESCSSGIFQAMEIGRGRFSLDELEGLIDITSKYSIVGRMEGIVVKPARILFYEEHLSGKIIRPEFEEGIEDHYRRKPAKLNQINPQFSRLL